jgi:hypothetical protein
VSNFRALAARLRREAGFRSDLPIAVEVVLPRLYPVAALLLPRLSVEGLRAWLARHQAEVPPALAACGDRRIRGAVVGWQGHGLLCAEATDAEAERRFTFAHEAAHFLEYHLYPRQDLLHRFGPAMQPVLDGQRPPSAADRGDALRRRAYLTLQTHLLERNPGGEASPRPVIDAAEAEADLFACEVLAPVAGLEARFSGLRLDEAGVARVQSALLTEYGLPPAPAWQWARRFVARQGEPVTLIHRLGLA